MLRFRYLIAACMVALTVGVANATTFVLSGAAPLSGSLDIDTVGGTVTGGSISYAGLGGLLNINDTFNILLTGPSFGQRAGCCFTLGNSEWEVSFNDALNGASGGYELALVFKTPPDPLSTHMPTPLGTLVGFTGGTIDHWDITPYGTNGLIPGGIDSPGSGNLSAAQTSTTPLPAALPLFATGLGALGLLGWRRKKKAAALAA